MINSKQLKSITGCKTFWEFRKRVSHSTWSELLDGKTKYYVFEDKNVKEYFLDLTFEELNLLVKEEK